MFKFKNFKILLLLMLFAFAVKDAWAFKFLHWTKEDGSINKCIRNGTDGMVKPTMDHEMQTRRSFFGSRKCGQVIMKNIQTYWKVMIITDKNNMARTQTYSIITLFLNLY